MLREWPSKRASRVEPAEAEWHPLAGKAREEKQASEPNKNQASHAAPPEEIFSDPLSRAAAARPVSDPLSAASDPLTAARSAALGDAPGQSSAGDEAGEDEEGAASGEVAAYVPWGVRKTQIVQQFTTTGNNRCLAKWATVVCQKEELSTHGISLYLSYSQQGRSRCRRSSPWRWPRRAAGGTRSRRASTPSTTAARTRCAWCGAGAEDLGVMRGDGEPHGGVRPSHQT